MAINIIYFKKHTCDQVQYTIHYTIPYTLTMYGILLVSCIIGLTSFGAHHLAFVGIHSV